ncbi:MAG: imelysin [Gammaproteobacteria bacterium]|nr:imelysin [Gammaproteobacteria bacterium]
MNSLKPLVTGIALAISMNSMAAVSLDAQQATLSTYASIADANYHDALRDAEALQAAIHALAKQPTAKNLQAAKNAWLTARESYGTTEIFRLANGPIDAEQGWVAAAYGAPEGQINAWPLDENMIDYTIDANDQRTHGNIIDSKGSFTPGGEDARPVDVSNITPGVLSELNENGGEANVATGYHAIEFLLWGQDQDYNNMISDKVTHGPMTAGERPLSDFTTDQYAMRRLAYLVAATDKLASDLNIVANAWDAKVSGTDGLYRAALLDKLSGADKDKNIPRAQAFRQIIAGLGVFAKSELANERIAVAVLTPSEEDEHSCFSDNTHRDIALNYQGIRNVLMGEYQGKRIGPSFFDQLPADEQAKLSKLMADIEARIAKVNELARTRMHFDYQIHPQNEESVQNIVTLKNELRRLGDQMVAVARAYGLSLNTNDVTDPEETKVGG